MIYVLAFIGACTVAYGAIAGIRQFRRDLRSKPSRYFLLPWGMPSCKK
jgi:hypothetical protein